MVLLFCCETTIIFWILILRFVFAFCVLIGYLPLGKVALHSKLPFFLHSLSWLLTQLVSRFHSPSKRNTLPPFCLPRKLDSSSLLVDLASFNFPASGFGTRLRSVSGSVTQSWGSSAITPCRSYGCVDTRSPGGSFSCPILPENEPRKLACGSLFIFIKHYLNIDIFKTMQHFRILCRNSIIFFRIQNFGDFFFCFFVNNFKFSVCVSKWGNCDFAVRRCPPLQFLPPTSPPPGCARPVPGCLPLCGQRGASPLHSPRADRAPRLRPSGGARASAARWIIPPPVAKHPRGSSGRI